MSKFFSMRRFSRSSGSYNQDAPKSPPTAYTPPLNQAVMANGSTQHDSRPPSSATDASFEFTSRPATHSLPQTNIATLSRTDQIVFRHFWDEKAAENKSRDLHFLKFPSFPRYPTHKDLIPYCEIYHLVKTSQGAKIISLGSASGVYIGFELFSGSQLHIDMEDEWTNIAHYRVTFKPYDVVLKDPNSAAAFTSWPKPLTIEFLEEQYRRWCEDLTSLCWSASEVRELGSVTPTDPVG